MRWIPMAFLTMALVTLGVAAQAEEGGIEENPREAHDNTDTNDDGRVDREEFRIRMVEIFYFADGDRDGYLVAAEFERTGFESRSFAKVDDNADGNLSLYEFVDATFEAYDDADSNDDGTLSVEEVVATYEENRGTQ